MSELTPGLVAAAAGLHRLPPTPAWSLPWDR